LPVRRDDHVGGTVRPADLLKILEQDPQHAYTLAEVVAGLGDPAVASASVFSALMGFVVRDEVELRLVASTSGTVQLFQRKPKSS